MKNRVFFLVIFSLSIFSLIFTACTKKNTKTKQEEPRIIIGFSQIGAESAWRTCNTESMQKAAADAGIQMIYDNAEQKQENQIKAIRSFIVYQVDVIVFVPIVQGGWDNVLKEAKDADIPVIILDRKMEVSDPSLYAGYIGTDSMEEGRSAARFLQRKYAGQSGPFNILELRGTDGSSVTEGRHDGFVEILNKDSRFNIVYSESGDFLRSCGREIIRHLIENNKSNNQINKKLTANAKPINIIYSHNDGMTLGALEVLEENRINAGKDITIISIDAQQEAIDALKNGKINCVIECNPKLGPECIDNVIKVADKQPIPRLIHVPKQVFTEFDDLKDIPERGY